MGVLVAGQLAAGCGEDAAPQGEARPLVPPWRSGERLHAIVRSHGVGSQVLARWWDTQLEIECAFELTEAGYRCVPVERYAFRGYEDDECTTAVVDVGLGCVEPGELLSTMPVQPGTCDRSLAVVELEEPGTAGYTRTHGFCAFNDGASSGWTGRTLELSMFVHADLSMVEVGGLRVRQLEGNDGSAQRLDVAGPAGKPCSSDMLEALGRCVPGDVIVAVSSADEECGGDAVAWVDECEPKPDYIAFQKDPGGLVVHEVGEPVDARFDEEIGTCRSSNGFGGVSISLGAEIDPSRFELVQKLWRGSDGLQSRWYGSPGTDPLTFESDVWFDPARRESCEPRDFFSGTHCVERPFENGGDTFLDDGPFVDADCTTRTLISRASSPPRTVFGQRGGECIPDAPTSVEPWTGPFFTLDDDRCVPTEPEPDRIYLVPLGTPPEFSEKIEEP